MATIEVLYSCKGCGIEKRPVKVKPREDEDAVAYVEYVTIAIAIDHRLHSKNCTSNECDLMIPMDHTKTIGRQSIQ